MRLCFSCYLSCCQRTGTSRWFSGDSPTPVFSLCGRLPGSESGQPELVLLRPQGPGWRLALGGSGPFHCRVCCREEAAAAAPAATSAGLLLILTPWGAGGGALGVGRRAAAHLPCPSSSRSYGLSVPSSCAFFPDNAALSPSSTGSYHVVCISGCSRTT